MFEPGRAQHRQQVVARKNDGTDDGRVVSFDLDRELYRGPDDEALRRKRSGRAYTSLRYVCRNHAVSSNHTCGIDTSDQEDDPKSTMTNMTRFKALLLATVFLALVPQFLRAQNKLLTIDDIFDPVKKVNFNGVTPTIRWLKDGNHYLLTNEASRRDVPRLQKVNAA